MTPHGLRRRLGIAGQHGAQNLEMLIDRRRVNIGQGPGTDNVTHQLHQIAIAGYLRRQSTISRSPGDGRVQLAIMPPARIDPSRLVAHRPKSGLATLQPFPVQPRRRQPGGLNFQESAHCVKFPQFFGAKGGENRTTISPQLHQPETLQLQQGLPHRRTADAEPFHRLRLGETITATPHPFQQSGDHPAHHAALSGDADRRSRSGFQRTNWHGGIA